MIEKQMLFIPPYWFYSVEMKEKTKIVSFQYSTIMNNLAILPQLCLHFLQNQNIKFETAKKVSFNDTIEVKEIKMRPGIDEHDYQVKMRNVKKFLGNGDKVKMTIRFRGREMVHQDLGLRVLDRVRTDLGEEIVKVEQFPKTEGRLMTMIVAPK